MRRTRVNPPISPRFKRGVLAECATTRNSESNHASSHKTSGLVRSYALFVCVVQLCIWRVCVCGYVCACVLCVFVCVCLSGVCVDVDLGFRKTAHRRSGT